MSQDNFYPFFQPPTGYWGSIVNAVLGRGTGKFRSSGYNYLPISQKVIMIDTAPGSLMNVAMQVPHLNTVISKGAEMFSLLLVKHLNKDGEEVENSPVLKFLKRPNPLQTFSQYLFQFYVLNAVYNKTFQYKIKGLSFERIPKAMWLLPSGWMKINPTGKLYRQTDINEIIENYELLGQESTDTFEVEKIIYIFEGVGNNILNPVSRIEALQIPLSNIVASMKSYNIIVSEKGQIGFISPEPSKNGEDNFIPFGSAEAEKMRLEYQNKFGMDSQGGHINITSSPMRWNSMSFPVGDLKLFEGVEEAFGSICDAYGHDRDIYSSTKGATYENKSAGVKSTIQNALQPLADRLMEVFTEQFIDPATGEKLVACYQHLPAMKEDERLSAQGKLYTVQAGEILLNNGVIDHDGFAEMADVEMSGDAVIVQRTPAQPLTPPAK